MAYGVLSCFYAELRGYNLLLSFTDDEVLVASENNDPERFSASFYSLKQSAGPVLTIDTYNENFHLFSDPDSEVSGVGTNGKGMEGDFEFLILKATPDSVVLKGRKTSNRIIMTPLPENESWPDYIKEIRHSSEEMRFKAFELQINGEIIPVSISFRKLIFTFQDDNGQEVSLSVPFIVTKDGYKFYSPLEIKGTVIDEFIFTEGGDSGLFESSNDTSVKLVPVILPLNEALLSGEWFFTYSGLGALGKLYWDYTKVNGLDVLGESPYYAYMGLASNGKYGFNFASVLAGTPYLGALYFNREMIGEDQVKFSFALTASGNGGLFYENVAFAYTINPLHGGGVKTFVLTTDNLSNPTRILLTDKDDPDNTMLLESQPIYWPFDN